jgi:hypothetical protein
VAAGAETVLGSAEVPEPGCAADELGAVAGAVGVVAGGGAAVVVTALGTVVVAAGGGDVVGVRSTVVVAGAVVFAGGRGPVVALGTVFGTVLGWGWVVTTVGRVVGGPVLLGIVLGGPVAGTRPPRAGGTSDTAAKPAAATEASATATPKRPLTPAGIRAL